MADSKISALPASTVPLAGTEVLPIVQSGATKQVAVSNLTAGRAVSAGTLLVTGASTQVSAEVFRNSATSAMRVAGGSAASLGANIILFGESHASKPGKVELTAVGTGSVAISSAGRALTLDSTAGNATLDSGNFVPSTAAKGINFTANTPAAGMTSQLLNWYEEGTWTPGLTASAGSATLTTAVGRYTRAGRIVFIELRIVCTAAPTGSNTRVTGLPFTSNGTANYFNVSDVFLENVTYVGIPAGFINPGTTDVFMATQISAGGYSGFSGSAFANNATVTLNGSYHI